MTNQHNIFHILPIFLITSGYGVSFPSLALQLEATGASSTLIGLNAAMPALCWILITPALPTIQRAIPSKVLMALFIGLALAGLFGLSKASDYTLLTVFRFVFGGSMGLFFRVFEYWLNATTENTKRGRTIGAYAIFFALGIATGSILQPVLEQHNFFDLAYSALFIYLGISLLLFSIPPEGHSPRAKPSKGNFALFARTLPVPFAAVAAYGFFEDIPAYLLPIYALKVGLDSTFAALSLGFFAFGGLVFAIPIGFASDRLGRYPILALCGIFSFFGAAALPFSTSNSIMFLTLLLVWGGFVVGLYATALAIVGDRYSGAKLVVANSAFGTLYAVCSLIGPLVNGAAMDLWEPHGIAIAAAATFLLFLAHMFFTVIQKNFTR